MVLDLETLHNSTIATAAVAKFQVYYKKINVKCLWKCAHFLMIFNRTYEQLTPIYDKVSATGKKLLLQTGHQIFDVFSIVANYFWKGVNKH